MLESIKSLTAHLSYSITFCQQQANDSHSEKIKMQIRDTLATSCEPGLATTLHLILSDYHRLNSSEDLHYSANAISVSEDDW